MQQKVRVLATPKLDFSVCGGGCIHLNRNTSSPAVGYVRWLIQKPIN